MATDMELEQTEARWHRVMIQRDELADRIDSLNALVVEQRRQRDELLAACEELCAAIKLAGGSLCNTYHDGPSLEFIEEHWIEHVAICLGRAYHTGQAAIAFTTGFSINPKVSIDVCSCSYCACVNRQGEAR